MNNKTIKSLVDQIQLEEDMNNICRLEDKLASALNVSGIMISHEVSSIAIETINYNCNFCYLDSIETASENINCISIPSENDCPEILVDELSQIKLAIKTILASI